MIEEKGCCATLMGNKEEKGRIEGGKYVSVKRKICITVVGETSIGGKIDTVLRRKLKEHFLGWDERKTGRKRERAERKVVAVTRGKKCIVVMIKGNFEEVEKKDTLVERKTRENSLVRVNGGRGRMREE